MSGESDEALMQAVREGDGDRLALLFSRHHARVHALCSRLTGNPDAAEDLTQDIFIRVWKYASRFEARSTFRTWLFRLAFNVCSDYRQSRSSRPHASLDDSLAAPAPAESAERKMLVEEALAQLPAEKRDVLILSRYEGLPYAEIARIVGCTPGAARVRAHRALNDLRTICRSLEKERA